MGTVNRNINIFSDLSTGTAELMKVIHRIPTRMLRPCQLSGQLFVCLCLCECVLHYNFIRFCWGRHCGTAGQVPFGTPTSHIRALGSSPIYSTSNPASV